MYRITIRIQIEPAIRSALLLLLMLFGGLVASSAAAEPHVLRASGRTLIEAEKYSSASTKHPRTESSPWCSGQANLGVLSARQVVRTENGSATGCSTTASHFAHLRPPELRSRFKESLTPKRHRLPRSTYLARIHGSPMRIQTSVVVSLPSGTCTLRFLNHLEDANVDYVTFLAGSDKDVTTFEPPDSVGSAGGPDRNPA